MQSLAQERQGIATMIPPHPPRNIIPPRLLEGPAVQISDIRKEPGRLTESEAREELSGYFIYRFELADHANDVDSDGEIVRPTWKNVVRVEVPGVSKKQAAREVKALSIDTRPLAQKKTSLTDGQQRQLEKALEELEDREPDPRYHYVLCQIDHKLRDKKVRHMSRGRYGDRYGDKRHGERKHGDKHRRTSEYRGRREIIEVDILGRRRSKVRDVRKKVKETVSITAYYKRCPKPDVDVMAMLWQREAENALRLQPPHPQHTLAAQQMQQHQQAMQNQQLQQANANMQIGMGLGIGMQMHPQHPQQGNKMVPNPNNKPGNNNIKPADNKGGNNNNNIKPGGIQILPNKPAQQLRKSPGPMPTRQPRSPTSSQESYYSDDSESDLDSASVLTPNSSHSSHSHPFPKNRRLSGSMPPTKQQQQQQHQRRDSRGTRYIESPAHFGIPPRTATPHKQRRHEEHRISDEVLLPHLLRRSTTLPPPAPAPPAPLRALGSEIDEIEANAYAAGRADAMADTRERAEAVLRPRVVQALPRRSLPAEMVYEDDVLPLPPSPPVGRVAFGPRAVQRRPSVRLVRAGEVALDEDVVESLERFRIEEDGVRRRHDGEGRGYGDGYYDDAILRNEIRRARDIEEARFREEEARFRDEEMAIERERERVERARGYLRRRESDDVVYERDRYDPLNRFAPRPGVVRRAKVGFGRQEYI
jgi:hypothetical protein